jgi:hypothetical protein
VSATDRPTGISPLESGLRELFVADAPAAAPGALRERVLRATETTEQLAPRARPLRRWGDRGSRPRLLLLVAAALVLALLAGASLVVGGRVRQPVTPTPAPSPAASPRPAWLTGGPTYPALEPGQPYSFDVPVPVTFSVPAGWDFWLHGYSDPMTHAGLASGIVNERYTASVVFVVVSNIYQDPCHSQKGLLDPPLGPTVDDLVTALAHLPGFVIAGPIDDTVGGLPAKTLAHTPTSPEGTCDGANDPMLPTPPGGHYAGGSMITRVLSVHGTRLMVLSWTPLPDPADAAADVATILKTVRFP